MTDSIIMQSQTVTKADQCTLVEVTDSFQIVFRSQHDHITSQPQAFQLLRIVHDQTCWLLEARKVG